MDKTIRTAPEIRFPGFKEPWEQRRLGNLGTTFTGLSGKAKQDFGHGEAQFVTYMNVYTNPISKLNMTEHVEIDNRQNKVQFGDIFFTTSSETPEEVGMSSVWLDNSDNTYLNSFCFGFRPKTSLSPYYMAYMLRSAGVREKIIFLAQGISRYNISKNRMMNIEVPLPTLNEQEKIGAFFKSVDALIFLHQRKHDFLQELKRGMLQVMFPQKGEKVPKVRFPGFTSPWEQRKLGDFGSVAMCKRIFKNQTAESGDIPFYKIGTFGGRPDAYISKELFDEYKKKYSYPENGDILISASGSIGRTVEYTGENAYYQDSNIVWLKHDNRIQNSFLKHLYEIIKWAGIEGSTIKRLYNNNILKTEVMVPSVKEQKIIGNYFEKLDNLITLHQRKLEQLREMKKGLLQKMFI